MYNACRHTNQFLKEDFYRNISKYYIIQQYSKTLLANLEHCQINRLKLNIYCIYCM